MTPLRFFNTLSGRVEDFVPLVAGRVGMYTCGPTVYSTPHIGNWRAYVFEDLLKRTLQNAGFKVLHVMNLTDVDDKTIRGANARGVDLDTFTAEYIAAFHEGVRTLRILPADHYPRATRHIPEMARMIKALLEKGYAYRKDGSIYFSIDKFPRYGRLSKIKREDLHAGVRVEADEYEKEHVQDFALWKAPKPGEPSWETEVGPGRPGWHIECSAMSLKYLGETFDIHCGGVDNIFPHHENEIAQSEAYSGKPFVRYWLHCHHLIVDGEKMSKSKGNVYTLADLRERGVDPMDLRFLLLSTHYRRTLNFTWEALAQAQASRRRLSDFLVSLRHLRADRPAVAELPGILEKARSGFALALGDDLNVSEAFSAVFEMVREVNSLVARDALGRADADTVLAALEAIDGVLGVLPVPEAGPLEDAILRRIAEREAARREKDYARADAIRRGLLDEGIVLEDTKDGVRWKRASGSA